MIHIFIISLCNDFKYHPYFTKNLTMLLLWRCTVCVLLYISRTCFKIINWFLSFSLFLSLSLSFSYNIYCLPSNVARLLYRSHAIAQYASNEYTQRLEKKIRDLWLVHVRRRRGRPGLDQGNGSLYATLHSCSR